jgi:hypothetical protein
MSSKPANNVEWVVWPDAPDNHKRTYRELLEQLALGDTVVFMGLTSSGVCSRLYRHAKRAKVKLVTRKIIRDGKVGVRVRRVS